MLFKDVRSLLNQPFCEGILSRLNAQKNYCLPTGHNIKYAHYTIQLAHSSELLHILFKVIEFYCYVYTNYIMQ